MRIPFLFSLFASLAFGQFASNSMSWRPEGDAMSVTISGLPVYSGYLVAGAPYSAERASERVQTLNDGTHITTNPQNKQKDWRDSQGRLRRETSLSKDGKFILVEIYDPVAGFSYVIEDAAKVVHRSALATPKPYVPAKTESNAPRRQQTHEDLGKQSIAGVICEGSSWTTTTPIGEIGNDRPIVSTGERWYSRELQLELLSKNFDPRQGEYTTNLTNLSRAEPDPSLFMLPEGYTVVDEKNTFTMTVIRSTEPRP
jgi:hypothetical protein